MILNLIGALLAINAGGMTAQNEFLVDNEIFLSEDCRLTASAFFDNPLSNQNTVIDLNGNVFLVQQCSNDIGFMIYDPVSNLSIETVKSAECPFNFTDSLQDYYFGPFNYYEKIGSSFYHCIDSDKHLTYLEAFEVQQNFDLQLNSLRSCSSEEAYADYLENYHEQGQAPRRLQKNGNKYYINNYKVIRDDPYPDNDDGYCGFVAASIVLNYWDKTVSNKVIDSAYKDSNGYLNTSGDKNSNLAVKLFKDYNDGTKWTTARTTCEAVNKYCKDYHVKGSASWYLLKIGLDDSILNDKPACIFGALPHVAHNNELVCHAIVAYGIDARWWGGYYIVHYGWSGFEEVSLPFGLAGETMTFSLDNSYYSRNYTLTPSDYGFASSYVASPTQKIVSKNEFEVSTNRLRCGYIENKFINLSPRKQGFDTAYLEFEFANPVTDLWTNISFWSNSEWYNYPNIAQAAIQYQELNSNGSTWITSLDLLNDINLSTDRFNQNTIHCNFKRKTKKIRFYAHFDHMSGWTDRNKGRISIKNIEFKTYL